MRITNIITIIGIIQGLFLLTLIIPNLKKSILARFAFFLLVTLTIDLFAYLIFDLELTSKFSIIFLALSNAIIYLYGPLFYLYVRSISVLEKHKFKRTDYLHFIPALIGIFVFTPFFIKKYLAPIILYLQNELPKLFGIYSLSNILYDFCFYYLHVIIYLIISYKLLKIIKKNQKQRFYHIQWLQRFFMAYFLIIGIRVAKFLVDPFVELQIPVTEILNVFLVLNFFVLNYIAFTNQTILQNPTQHFIKYKKSKLSSETKEEYIRILLNYFENEHPYLAKDLTLNYVAENLNISRNYLSQILNDDLGKGFNEFVNDYRVALAKIYLISSEKENLTIEAIGNEVGFKSKSSFNAAFKKNCGITPSKFKSSY